MAQQNEFLKLLLTCGMEPRLAASISEKVEKHANDVQDMASSAPTGATLKLADIENPVLRRFAKGFRDSTFSNPTAWPERLWPRSDTQSPVAGFDVRTFEGRIWLNYIRSFGKLGEGNGSRALDWLCKLADFSGLTIRGRLQLTQPHQQVLDAYIEGTISAKEMETLVKAVDAHVIGPGLSMVQVRAWLTRHGFSVKKYDLERKAQPYLGRH